MSGIINSAGSKSGVIGTTEIDYEEGAWTAAMEFGGSTSGMSQSGAGTYTKVGRLVHIQAMILITNMASVSGDAVITGLPFANPSGNEFNAPCAVGDSQRVEFDDRISCQVINNSSTITLRQHPNSGAVGSALNETDFDTGNVTFSFGATYQTAT